MIMSHVDLLQPKASTSILESGIKYIMFPLHLLRFCIFGPSTTANAKEITASEDKLIIEEQEPKVVEVREKKEEPEQTPRVELPVEESPKSSKSDLRDDSKISAGKKCKEEDSDSEDSDEMVTAAEDSDTSDHWTTANNMSVDHDSFLDKTILYHEEPMDISIDEQTIEKYSPVKTPQRGERVLDSSKNEVKESPRSRDAGHGNGTSLDEEISRMFQKQCTSSDEEYSYSRSTRQNSHYKETVAGSRPRKEYESEYDRKKKSFVDLVMNKRRKTDHDRASEKSYKSESKSVRKSDQKSVQTQEEKRATSKHITPNKSKSRSPRTPTKNKESKGRDVKYKDRGTQTDSAYSDDDVEMTPIDFKPAETRSYRYTNRKLYANLSQVEEMDQDWDYRADNEDSNDGSVKFACKGISSGSTSSLSSDLGFEDRACTTPEVDGVLGSWQANPSDIKSRICRAPPGFPEMPQNPPISCVLSEPGIQTLQAVAPAPTPMRHLYYEYPEFMIYPENSSSSQVTQTILRYNYYR